MTFLHYPSPHRDEPRWRLGPSNGPAKTSAHSQGTVTLGQVKGIAFDAVATIPAARHGPRPGDRNTLRHRATASALQPAVRAASARTGAQPEAPRVVRIERAEEAIQRRRSVDWTGPQPKVPT